MHPKFVDIHTDLVDSVPDNLSNASVVCQLVGAQQRAFDNRSAIVNFFNLFITTLFLVSTYFRTRQPHIIFLHGDIDNFGDIANIATFASAFFSFVYCVGWYPTSLIIRRARDESLVIPWRYLGGSLDVTLPITYPNRRHLPYNTPCSSPIPFLLKIK